MALSAFDATVEATDSPADRGVSGSTESILGGAIEVMTPNGTGVNLDGESENFSLT